MVDFEVITHGGEDLGSIIKDKISDAVKSKRMGNFSVSAKSYKFTSE